MVLWLVVSYVHFWRSGCAMINGWLFVRLVARCRIVGCLFVVSCLLVGWLIVDHAIGSLLCVCLVGGLLLDGHWLLVVGS